MTIFYGSMGDQSRRPLSVDRALIPGKVALGLEEWRGLCGDVEGCKGWDKGNKQSCLLTADRAGCHWGGSGHGCSSLVLTRSSSYISGMCRGPVPIPVSTVGLGKEGRQCLLGTVTDALCVHQHSPTTQELDLHFWPGVNGLFVKRRTFVSIRKHPSPAISP